MYNEVFGDRFGVKVERKPLFFSLIFEIERSKISFTFCHKMEEIFMTPLTKVSEEKVQEFISKFGQYTLKHTKIGYWIDGICGYKYISYTDTLKEVWEKFLDKKLKEIEKEIFS